MLWYAHGADWFTCRKPYRAPGLPKSQGVIFLKVFSSLLFCKVQNTTWFGWLSYCIQLCFGNGFKLTGLLRHNPVAGQFVCWKLSDVISTSLYMNSSLLHPTQPFCSFLSFTAIISWPQILSHEYKVAGEVSEDVTLAPFQDFNEYFLSCLNSAM